MKFYFENALREWAKNTKKELRAYRNQAKKVIRTLEKEVEEVTFKVERRLRISVARFKDALRKRIKSIPPLIDDAFTVDSPSKAATMAQVYGEELASALYETQLRIEGLENAIIRVAAPLAQAVVPIVNTAVKALTALANTAGKIVASFFAGSQGVDAYEKSLRGAAKTTGSFTWELAGFDQIERLGKNGSSGLTSALIPDAQEVIPGWEKVAGRLQELLAPLRDIDFSPAIEATRRALKALEPVVNAVGEAAQWVIGEILVPAIKWAAENVLPAFIEMLGSTLEVLGQTIEDIKPTLNWLWENFLKHIAQWYGDKIIADIQAMGEGFRGMCQGIRENMPTVNTIIEKFDELFDLGESLRTDSALWQQILGTIAPVLSNLSTTMNLLPGPMGSVLSILAAIVPALGEATSGFDGLGENAALVFNGIQSMLSGIWSYSEEKVVEPAQAGTKQFLNNIIGFFESTIKGITGAYNKMFAGLNGNFENMETVAPSIGAAARNVRLSLISMPSIPRLAQGAVLPANKPFMAVVGDQKNGTNIEAPLETIQQALSMTLSDRMEGMMAGFHAVTSRQEQILDAILGLDVSDGALAGAVKRYERKMALATGGI